MRKYLFYVLGYGYFGQRAVQKIYEKYGSKADIVVVDQETGGKSLKDRTYIQALHHGDALLYLYTLASQKGADECWIIPAIPQHVAYEYVLHELNKEELFEVHRIPVPENLELPLPFQFRSEQGTLYSSMARFRCPDDCEEPEDYCTATGHQRDGVLYEMLQELRFPNYSSLVLRSRQIAPGLGGFLLGELNQLKAGVVSRASQNGWEFFLISTSCKCHGVTDGLQVRQRGNG